MNWTCVVGQVHRRYSKLNSLVSSARPRSCRRCGNDAAARAIVSLDMMPWRTLAAALNIRGMKAAVLAIVVTPSPRIPCAAG